MYFAGLLAPVRFIGERKGTLSVLIDSQSASWEENTRAPLSRSRQADWPKS